MLDMKTQTLGAVLRLHEGGCAAQQQGQHCVLSYPTPLVRVHVCGRSRNIHTFVPKMLHWLVRKLVYTVHPVVDAC